MQIQLKQPEIEAALKQFIGQQGINLANKTIEIAFTSGRKDNGLSAEIIIEDVKSTAPPLSVPPSIPPQVLNRYPQGDTGELTAPEVKEPPTDEAIPAKATSLFN